MKRHEERVDLNLALVYHFGTLIASSSIFLLYTVGLWTIGMNYWMVYYKRPQRLKVNILQCSTTSRQKLTNIIHKTECTNYRLQKSITQFNN